MGAIASQITSLTIVYSIVYSDADQRKHQSSASLAFVRGIHPAQMASYAENVSIWWRHHGYCHIDRFLSNWEFLEVDVGVCILLTSMIWDHVIVYHNAYALYKKTTILLNCTSVPENMGMVMINCLVNGFTMWNVPQKEG